MTNMPKTDNDYFPTHYLKDCVRKARPLKYHDVALLGTVPITLPRVIHNSVPNTIQSLMYFSKQLKLLYEKQLSATVTYVGPIHPTTDKELSSFIQQCTKFKPIAVIMFGKI